MVGIADGDRPRGGLLFLRNRLPPVQLLFDHSPDGQNRLRRPELNPLTRGAGRCMTCSPGRTLPPVHRLSNDSQDRLNCFATGAEPPARHIRSNCCVQHGADPAARLIPFQAFAGCLKLPLATGIRPPARQFRSNCCVQARGKANSQIRKLQLLLKDPSSAAASPAPLGGDILSPPSRTRGAKIKYFLPCKKKNKAMDNIQAR